MYMDSYGGHRGDKHTLPGPRGEGREDVFAMLKKEHVKLSL
jgi:hypothetical protein